MSNHTRNRKQTLSPITIIVIAACIIIALYVAGALAYRYSPGFREWAADTGLIPPRPLTDGQWTWQSSEFPNGSTIGAPGGGAFTLVFEEGGHFTSTTDCNSAFGTYSVFGERLNIDLVATTRMACAPDSLEAEYVKQLSRASSFLIIGNELHVTLADDSGSMLFMKTVLP